jgi:hypothetical protein
MRKYIKVMLEKQYISIKWKNFNGYKKLDDITNLYEACMHYRISIKAIKDNSFTIKYKDFIELTVKNVPFYDLERQIVFVITAINLYLGDRTIIRTRFSFRIVNF